MLRLTLGVSKGIAGLSRGLGGGGQAVPGLVAQRLDRSITRTLAARLPHGVVIVTGTNGKTTTTKLITAILEAAGEHVLTNTTGSNLSRGITSALVQATDWRGRTDRTIAVLEVDEATVRRVAGDLDPRAVVVLNLFRDQLDRYSEVDATASLIAEGVTATAATLHLNADDPRVAGLATTPHHGGGVRFFGIEALGGEVPRVATAADSDRCPRCGTRLAFSRVFFGHIGHYTCPAGDFTRPHASIRVRSVTRSDARHTEFTVSQDDGPNTRLTFSLPGTYNLYNALAAISLATGLGIPMEVIARTLSVATPAVGRVERVRAAGRTVCLVLVKNPAGFSQVLETFLLDHRSDALLFVINDLDADGRDVSWLWDVPLEILASREPRVVVAGARAHDMALRLKYAGIDTEISAGPDAGVRRLLELTADGAEAYVLATYTAMAQVHSALRGIGPE